MLCIFMFSMFMSDGVNDYVSLVAVTHPLGVPFSLDARVDVYIDKCDICVDCV